MKNPIRGVLAALAASTLLAGPAAAELTGTLKIASDMSNPAPRAVMEDMVARFGEMHPGLEIELTITDREAACSWISRTFGPKVTWRHWPRPKAR